MAWKDTITFAQKSHKSFPSVSTEGKTVDVTVEKTRPVIINGVPTGATVTYNGTEQKEYSRPVYTTTLSDVYESTGFMEEEAAKALVTSSGWADVAAGSQQLTEMEAFQAAGANGWKVRKTVTKVTVTRGAWVEVTE